MLTCGLDIGSTNVKVVLADDAGRSRWVKAVPTPRRHDGTGIATDAGALVVLLEDMIIAGWRAAGRGLPLKAIAAAGVGEDGVCVDGGLQPLGLAIPWFDKRAMAEVAIFAAAYALTRVDFQTTAAKWMWLRRNRPPEIATARQWLTLTDYASSIWCGEPFISETLAARTGCYDVMGRNWNAEALQFCAAPALPRVLKAGQAAGTLAAGRLRQSGAANAATLIVAGGHDHPIAASAIQRLDARARVDSLGTANVVYGETQVARPALAGSNLEASVPARGGPGVALMGVIEFSATLLGSFGGESVVRKYLSQSRLPGSPARPAHGDDGGDHRLRQVLEDMARGARRFLAAMDRAGVPHGPIFATGGWARSTALIELRASMFGEAITIVDEPELVGLGAALLGLEGANGAPAVFRPVNGLHVVDPLVEWMEAYGSI